MANDKIKLKSPSFEEVCKNFKSASTAMSKVGLSGINAAHVESKYLREENKRLRGEIKNFKFEDKRLRDINLKVFVENRRLQAELEASSALLENSFHKPFKMIEERFKGAPKRSFDAKKTVLLLLAALLLFAIVGTIDYSVMQNEKSTNKIDLAIDNETESN